MELKDKLRLVGIVCDFRMISMGKVHWSILRMGVRILIFNFRSFQSISLNFNLVRVLIWKIWTYLGKGSLTTVHKIPLITTILENQNTNKTKAHCSITEKSNFSKNININNNKNKLKRMMKKILILLSLLIRYLILKIIELGSRRRIIIKLEGFKGKVGKMGIEVLLLLMGVRRLLRIYPVVWLIQV